MASSTWALAFDDLLNLVNLQTLLVLVLVYHISSHLANWYRSYTRLPPGPRGVPIVGMIPFIKKEFHLFLDDQRKKFGNIYSFKMGGETMVVLSDPDIIRQAFSSRDFVARPKSELSGILNGYGIINSEGPLWQSQRRFLINQKLGMRHWGACMETIEGSVQRESLGLLRTVLEDHIDGSAFNPAPLINVSVANVICSMIMSTRFSKDDPKFQHFMNLFDEGFRLFADTGAVTFIPQLRHLPGVRSAVKQIKENHKVMLNFAKEIIDDHKSTLDANAPRDLVDQYLLRITELRETEGGEGELFHGFEAEEQLQQIVLDLFSAGVETLKTSLLWAILYMMHNKEELAKVQEEMDRVIGHERLPMIKDFAEMPYTRAVLYESMRKASVVPMGTTHATEREVQFEGYTLPKNTHVIPLLHAVHNDDTTWEQPEQFRPERFLSDDGKTVIKPKHFMPFCAGRRMCLGDQLAEKEFFLFFTTFFHSLDVTTDKLVSCSSGVAGVTVSPNQYEVVCQPRPQMLATIKEALLREDDESGAIPCRTYG